MTMKINKLIYLFLVVFFTGTASAAPEPKEAYTHGRELTIAEVLLAAEGFSPQLKAAAAREVQAAYDIGIAKSYYYPTVDIQGIQSYGFPGSEKGLNIEGIVDSPFRKGVAGGFVSKMTLVDLVRDSHLETTRSLLKTAQAQTRIVRYQVDLAALEIYFDCVRYRGLATVWQNIAGQISEIIAKISRLVETGQQSPVDLWLVQLQAEDAEMNRSVSAEQYRIGLERLALITGLDKQGIDCPDPSAIDAVNLDAITAGTISPFVEHAQNVKETAKYNVREKMAERFPKFMTLTTVGTMDRTRLGIKKEDYSVGFGITMPLFEGFRINKGILQAKSLFTERDENVLAELLNVGELNLFYDGIIGASRIKLQFLDHQSKITYEAIGLAKDRYLSFIGPLVDVREAFRDLAAVETQRSNVKVDLLLALSKKVLINGGYIERRK